MHRIPIDELDSQILDCYKENPRASAAAVAKTVNLSEGAVRDRTKKLVDAGVLSFEVAIDYDRISSYSLHAYVEVSFPGNTNVHQELQVLADQLGRKELREAITLVGDVDAMIRLRARDVVELRELVSGIRAHRSVIGTKTRIIAGSWWHGANADRAAT